MVVTYGEALVDMIEMPDGRFAAVLGGSVCNFTQAMARQGLAVSYLNPLSRDEFGRRFARLLDGAGVRLASPAPSAQPTSLAVITLDANKTPSYVFHRHGVADRDITAAQACVLLPAAPRLFHSGGLALVTEDVAAARAIAAQARARGALVSIDANMRPLVCPDVEAYAAGVRRMLAEADLIKVSEEDLEHLGYAGQAPLEAARALLHASGAKLLALTLGADGAVLLTPHVAVALAAPAGLAVVDSVGCGDSFWAGLLSSLDEGGLLDGAALAALGPAALERALRAAVACASLNLMREGCQPPDRAERDAFLAAGLLGAARAV